MKDEFSGDTGLKENFDGTITSPEFTQSQRGNWGLHFTIAADDGEEVERTYSVGGADKGWTSYDGGETIEGPSAKARFHVRSSIQKFIDDCMTAGAGDALRERSKTQFNSRGPFHAALWNGLRFHWDVVQRTEPSRTESGEWVDKETDVMVPVKFLGVAGGVQQSPQPAAQAAPTGDSQAASQAAVAASNGADIHEMDLKMLKGLAKSANDHGNFADLVMEAADHAGEPFIKNKAVMKKIGQEDFYNGLLV